MRRERQGAAIPQDPGHQRAITGFLRQPDALGRRLECTAHVAEGPEPVPPGEELTVDYQPSAFAEGMSPGDVLAIGRSPTNVSFVNVEFSDGTVVTAATNPAAPDTSDRYWIAVTSLAGDSQDISVTNLTDAGVEGR